MSETVIDAALLSCRAGSAEILRDISFSVARGEYVSIIGPNGAGKTTLLKCLNRISPISGGEMRILGRPLRSHTQRELAKIVSYVPQADARYFPFTVFEFVLMGRYPYLSPFTSISSEDKRIADECLALTGTEAFARRFVHTLSGGERQSVFIAAALAQGARILLLDEPTTFLDYRHQISVQSLLRRLNREQGITIIAVTHDVTAAVWSSTRVFALKDGRLVFHGEPHRLETEGILETVYDTPIRFVRAADLEGPLVVPVERKS